MPSIRLLAAIITQLNSLSREIVDTNESPTLLTPSDVRSGLMEIAELEKTVAALEVAPALPDIQERFYEPSCGRPSGIVPRRNRRDIFRSKCGFQPKWKNKERA